MTADQFEQHLLRLALGRAVDALCSSLFYAQYGHYDWAALDLAASEGAVSTWVTR